MDHYRSLYKANLNPIKCNRREANQIRAHKRSELYTSTRNISPSRSSNHNQCSAREVQEENSETINPKTEKLSESKKFVSTGSKISQKLSRQKTHILKFLAWKTDKAIKAQIKEKSKRAPFIVSTRNCAAAQNDLINNIKNTSFAPANHIFRQPSTLQIHELKVIGSNSLRLINGIRKETFHFLATPKRKANMLKSGVSTYKKQNPVPRTTILKPISDTAAANPRVVKLVLNPKHKLDTTTIMPKSTMIWKADPGLKKSSSSISTVFLTASGNNHLRPRGLNNSAPNNLAEVKSLEQTRNNVTNANQGYPFPIVVTSDKRNSLSPNDSRCGSQFFEKKKAHPINESISNSAESTPDGRAAMLKLVPGKTHVATTILRKVPLNSKPKDNTKFNAQDFVSKPKNNSHLLKPKADLPPIKRSTFKAPKKSSSSVSNAFMALTGKTHLPREHLTLKLKGKSDKKSPVTVVKPSKKLAEPLIDVNQGYPFLNVVTSTKRKAMSSKESSLNSLFIEMSQLVSPVDDVTVYPVDDEKFNFLRYSIVQSDTSKTDGEFKSNVTAEVHVTPDKAAGQPTTYLSPYVSVSRGKVGIQIERAKRNVYMSADRSVEEDADTTAKSRHIMATVHYYRKLLEDEITRLNLQCDTWQQYKEVNAHLVEDCGSDMINVTIGQTNLLTTKKLKQFGDLIDRCENGAIGKKSLGKRNEAKPILADDLEGFWSMVGLQIENVDKRFANLQRWKENNWKDPDEVLVKSANLKRNLKKTKKLKPGNNNGPNRDLQKILRNAQIAFLRKKAPNSELDNDVILTPSKSRQVLIKDRRSRSTAATVITLNTPKINPKSYVLNQDAPIGITPNKKMLPLIHGFRKSMNLFNTLLNKQENKSPGTINCTTPLPLSRKSILKTPGSIRRPKNVVFNSPTLQFTVTEGDEELPPQRRSQSKLEKEVEEERTYTLRTRNIKLRDLADILIPE